MAHLNTRVTIILVFFGILLPAHANAQPNELGAHKRPSSSSRRSLNTLDCGDYGVLASRALEKNMIKSINATITSEGNVYVRQESVDGKIKSFTRPNDNIVDWKNLKGNVRRRQTGDECVMGKAVLGYIETLNSGILNNLRWTEMSEDELIYNIKGFYLVDISGVDKIIRDGWSLNPGVVKRAFGTQTIYLPEDITRYIIWDKTEQSLRIKNTVKNSETGEIQEDLLSKALTISFKLDESLSKAYGISIYSSNVYGSKMPKTCVKWGNKHHLNTCVEYSPVSGDNSGQYFLTKEFGMAKRLFTTLTPNARMISSRIKPAQKNLHCLSEMFCDLPGGDYLNAIYEGDIYRVRTLDTQYLKSLNDLTEKVTKDNIIVKKLFDLITNNNHPSLLPLLAREYLHEYKNRDKKCFKPGAKKLTFEANTGTYSITDGYGVEISRSEGITLYGAYFINKEFINLCQEVCGPRGWGAALSSHVIAVSGVSSMQHYDCDSNEIKQFERNLIALQAFKHTGYKLFYQRNSPL